MTEHVHAEPCLMSKLKAFARRAWPWVLEIGWLTVMFALIDLNFSGWSEALAACAAGIMNGLWCAWRCNRARNAG